MTEDSRSARPVPARTGSRQVILDRVRAAAADLEPVPIPRNYRHAEPDEGRDVEAMLETFVDRLLDYRAEVTRCSDDEVGAVVSRFLQSEGAVRIVVPTGFPSGWEADPMAESAGVVTRGDDTRLSHGELDACDAVITTCAVAVAETGTIVLDGGEGQGRRALTLLPDLHVVIVATDQLVARVPDALGRLDPRRPLTWISGPSATSDIELDRVEGVHGPRRLRVVIVDR